MLTYLKNLKSAALALAVLAAASMNPLSACSYVEQDKNGVFTVTDCWCKTCQTWTTTDRDLVRDWMKAALIDNELC
jgi:hypothetical protein